MWLAAHLVRLSTSSHSDYLTAGQLRLNSRQYFQCTLMDARCTRSTLSLGVCGVRVCPRRLRAALFAPLTPRLGRLRRVALRSPAAEQTHHMS
jgi:hypothetical protein